jgi:hypothetical protein
MGSLTTASLVPGLIAAGLLYGVYQGAAPFLAIRRHLKEARAVGLPVQIQPVPQGLFSFFAFQVATKLHLVRPGSWLHRILNAGRPDGHSAHKDLGKMRLNMIWAPLMNLLIYRRLLPHCEPARRRARGSRPVRCIPCLL